MNDSYISKITQISIRDTMDSSDGKEDGRRVTWKKDIDYVITILGCTVGLGNVWRFPYYCYKNGGGCFLIAYFLLAIFLVFPLIVIEGAVGQYTGNSVVKAWKIVPIMKGIGFASTMTLFYSDIFYPVILAWALRWFVTSFSSTLPWKSCNNSWNTYNCTEIFEYNTDTKELTAEKRNDTSTSFSSQSSSVDEFWRIRILGQSSGVDDIGSIQWELLICLLCVWVLLYFSVWKGIGWASKIIYVTASLPMFMMIVVLVRGCTLDGASNGIHFYLKPNISRMGNIEMWSDAASQIFYSLGACFGTLTTLSGFNKFKHNFMRDLVILVIGNAFASLTAGFAIFSVLGFLANVQNVTVADVAESGPGLVFVVYPTALALLPLPQLWCALFFFVILLLGIDTLIAGEESQLACLAELVPQIQKRRLGREKYVAMAITVKFFLGIALVTEGGIYLFNILNEYAAAGWCMFFIALSEFVAVGWFYGADKMLDNIHNMLGYNVPRIWFKFCWKFTGPIIAALLIAYSLVQYRPLVYNRTYVYPVWANVLGWILALSSSMWIPATAIYICLKQTDKSFGERIGRKTKQRTDLDHQFNEEID